MNKSKRGRKPKSNIVINTYPIFDNNNCENIILKLKQPKNIVDKEILIDDKKHQECILFNNHKCQY
jgi:hypothetical protein